jgi:hypothetical protein
LVISNPGLDKIQTILKAIRKKMEDHTRLQDDKTEDDEIGVGVGVGVGGRSRQRFYNKKFANAYVIISVILIFLLIGSIFRLNSAHEETIKRMGAKNEEDMVARAKNDDYWRRVWELELLNEWETMYRADGRDGLKIKAIVDEELQNNQYTPPLNGRVLIFIMSAYDDVKRRNLIRERQIERFKDDYPIDWVFFLGDTPETYMNQLKEEMAKYNDIIQVPGVVETHQYASTEKFYANLKYIEEHRPGYSLVCKIDGDAYLNLPVLYPEYMAPNLNNSEPTLIGRVWDFEWRWQPFQPHINIAFVALNWKLMRIINRIHEFHFKGFIIHDERRISHYLRDDVIMYKLIPLPHETAADYHPEERDLKLAGHVVINGCVYVHELKDEEKYTQVTACFTRNGLDIDKMNQLQFH